MKKQPKQKPKQKPAKSSDPFHRLKNIAYCLANTPPKPQKCEFTDYVEHAKFHLCKATNTLMNDPVWERYTSDEEILVEYFAHMFATNDAFTKGFEQNLNQDCSDDTYDWFDKQIEKNKKAITDVETLSDDDDDFEFTPEALGT